MAAGTVSAVIIIPAAAAIDRLFLTVIERSPPWWWFELVIQLRGTITRVHHCTMNAG
jgi:hypothetical protein